MRDDFLTKQGKNNHEAAQCKKESNIKRILTEYLKIHEERKEG